MTFLLREIEQIQWSFVLKKEEKKEEFESVLVLYKFKLITKFNNWKFITWTVFTLII